MFGADAVLREGDGGVAGSAERDEEREVGDDRGVAWAADSVTHVVLHCGGSLALDKQLASGRAAGGVREPGLGGNQRPEAEGDEPADAEDRLDVAPPSARVGANDAEWRPSAAGPLL